jgi:hypothetical protein
MSDGTNKDNNQGDRGGEGNYDASRRYADGVQQSVQKGRSGDLAEKAKEALEGDEADELRRAEQQGKNAETPKK